MAHVTEQTPLLQDESAPPAHTADDGQNTISNGSDHPHGYSWRVAAVGQWFSLIGGLAVFGLAAAVSVIHRHCRPELYHIARDIKSYLETMVILVHVTEGLITVFWAASNLLHLLTSGTLMPFPLSALLYAISSFFTIPAVVHGMAALLTERYFGYFCADYPEWGNGRWEKCAVWAERFHRLVWAYLYSVLALSLIHAVLFVACFVACFVAPYSGRTSLRGRQSRQLTLQFTFT